MLKLRFILINVSFVCFVALRPKSATMVMAGRLILINVNCDCKGMHVN